MQYSTNPYRTWKPVEAQTGNLYFPDHKSLLHSLPSIQNHPPNIPPPGQKPVREQVLWSQKSYPKTQNDYYQDDHSDVRTFSYKQNPFATKTNQQTREKDYNQKTESHKM